MTSCIFSWRLQGGSDGSWKFFGLVLPKQGRAIQTIPCVGNKRGLQDLKDHLQDLKDHLQDLQDHLQDHF